MKDIPVCGYCGKKLPRFTNYQHLVDIGRTPRSQYGYKGNGVFCTLTCGYKYGLHLARSLRHQGR